MPRCQGAKVLRCQGAKVPRWLQLCWNCCCHGGLKGSAVSAMYSAAVLLRAVEGNKSRSSCCSSRRTLDPSGIREYTILYSPYLIYMASSFNFFPQHPITSAVDSVKGLLEWEPQPVCLSSSSSSSYPCTTYQWLCVAAVCSSSSPVPLQPPPNATKTTQRLRVSISRVFPRNFPPLISLPSYTPSPPSLPHTPTPTPKAAPFPFPFPLPFDSLFSPS